MAGLSAARTSPWTWVHSPAFRVTPLDLKAEADQHFLAGVNQLIGHGWPYSPPQAGTPGWSFYAAGVFNDKNPWWPVMPDLALYLQRLSYLLRQGEPVADIALYAPTEDAWSTFRIGAQANVDLYRRTADWIGLNVIPPVRDPAAVLVNDRRAGTLWCPPYRIEVTDLVRDGANEFRIEVYNTAINQLAEGGRLPDYESLVERYGLRFRMQDMENLEPLPSGIVSVVRLVAER